jgi:hypothetical protein
MHVNPLLGSLHLSPLTKIRESAFNPEPRKYEKCCGNLPLHNESFVRSVLECPQQEPLCQRMLPICIAKIFVASALTQFLSSNSVHAALLGDLDKTPRANACCPCICMLRLQPEPKNSSPTTKEEAKPSVEGLGKPSSHKKSDQVRN